MLIISQSNQTTEAVIDTDSSNRCYQLSLIYLIVFYDRLVVQWVMQDDERIYVKATFINQHKEKRGSQLNQLQSPMLLTEYRTCSYLLSDTNCIQILLDRLRHECMTQSQPFNQRKRRSENVSHMQDKLQVNQQTSEFFKFSTTNRNQANIQRFHMIVAIANKDIFIIIE